MKRLDDGFPTFMSFSLSSTLKFWEKEVTPIGWDGGGANDTTTMRNTALRTFSPKKLLTLSEMSFTCAYDPVVLDELATTHSGAKILQVNQQITIHFSDGSRVVFWGWIDAFKPQRTVEGSQPVAEVSIFPSNHDNTTPLPLEVFPAYFAS